jgi:SAM-dependent methyltransferase
MRLIPNENESFPAYFCRLKLGVLRRILPSLRERFILESLVGPIGCWEQLQNYQLECLKTVGLRPHHSLLDIGCGPLSGGLRLIEYLDIGSYIGIDIRAEPLTHAYNQIAKCGLVEKNPTLILSSTFGQDELGRRTFDYIWASQVTYHLNDEQIEELFQTVTTRLKPDGRFCCDVLLEKGNLTEESKWRGFSFYIRPMSFFEEMGKQYDCRMICRGQLADYGYPQKVRLKRNSFLEFRKCISKERTMSFFEIIGIGN